MTERGKPVSECHRAALEYLDRGWQPALFCPPDHVGVGSEHARGCKSPGKRPLGPWQRLMDAPQQRWLVDSNFAHHPNGNVGLVLGRVSGLVAVDVDGPAGRQLLRELSGGELPETPTFKTFRGLRYLYALAAGEVPPRNRGTSRSGLEGQVEVLSQGRCTVMPPSRHRQGVTYRWLPSLSPAEVKVAPAPGWLFSVVPPRPEGAAYVAGEAIGEGARNRRLFVMACAVRRHGATEAEILALLRAVNAARCRPPLEDAEVAAVARSAARYLPSAAELETVGGE